MPGVEFQRTYPLGDIYICVKNRDTQLLNKYLELPNIYIFNDSDRSITYSSERLIPIVSINRPRVMLLFRIS